MLSRFIHCGCQTTGYQIKQNLSHTHTHRKKKEKKYQKIFPTKHYTTHRKNLDHTAQRSVQ